MKTGVLCLAVLTAMVAQPVSAAFRSACFGRRCGFQSSNSVNNGFQPRYSQNQYQSNNYNRRFNQYRPASRGFGSSTDFRSNRFGTSPNHFSSSRGNFISNRGQFSSPSTQFGSQFGSGQRQFSSPSGQFGSRFGGFGRRQSQFRSQLAGATAEQRYRAQLATSRQLSQRRRQEQQLLQGRSGIVRPGSASAVLAAEKRADPKSLALGNQALQQILYMQNLVGAGRRR